MSIEGGGDDGTKSQERTAVLMLISCIYPLYLVSSPGKSRV